jgi:PAS domain S-box-containing protein
MAGKPIYGLYDDIAVTTDPICRNEGLRAVAVIPVKDKLKIRGALNLASHSHDEIPEDARYAIQAIASQIGGVFGRLEAEASLQESQKDLQTLFDSVEDFVFVLDADGNILNVNPTVEKRLGFSADELSSMHVLELHPIEQRGEAAAFINEIMTGNLTECPIPLLAKSGVIIPVETKVTKGRWRGRDVLFGISRDITRQKKAEERLQRAHDELERKVELRTAELANANERLTAEIAEHTRTEAKLRESEGNYRELFNAEPDAIIIFDAENKNIIDANPSALNLYGYRYEEMCGLSALSLSAEPEKSKQHINGIARELGSGHYSVPDYRRHKRKNGTVFPVEIVAGSYRHKGRKLICAIFRDNTAREQAEKALKRSEQNYRLLIDNQTDMVVKVDTQGRFLFVSPSYCEKFGKTEEELLGKTFLPLVHADDRQATTAAMEKLCRPPHTAYVEQRALTKDGWRWLAWADSAILNDKNEVEAIIGVGRDVTERKRAQEALEAEKERLTVTLRSIGDGVITTDQGGTITLINKVAENLTGWEENSALGQPIEEVFHIVDEQTRKRCENPVQRVIENGQITGLTNHTKLIRKDGKEFIIADSGAPIISKGGR